jgi:glycosyltransferase involved in cell wall biosynthesis
MKLALLMASVSRRGGGIFQAVRILAQALHRPPALEAVIVGARDDATDQDRPAWGGLPVSAGRIRGPRTFGYSKEMDAALAEANVDLLHVHGLWAYPSIASRRWADATTRPYIVAPHGMLDPWAVRNSRGKKVLASLLYERGHLRGAACLHALCEAEVRAIRAFGLKNPVCVIANGVEPPDPADAQRRHPIGRDLEGRPILLFTGRLHPKKGLVPLLRGWRLAGGCTPALRDWRLVIAGWDEAGHREELKRLCRELEITDSVRFLGPVAGADKHALFRTASALVLPSLSEGLPMTVLEAWSHGLPAMLTPQCNLPEGFTAAAGLRIEPTARAVALGLAELASMTPSERQLMGARGCGLVQRLFSPQKVAAGMAEVYRWVLGGGQRPAGVHAA